MKEEANFEALMQKALNPENPSKAREKYFDMLYKLYIKSNKNENNWSTFRIKLREKFANKLDENQKIKYGLTRKSLSKSYFELKNLSKVKRGYFPIELFYATSLSLINKILKKNAKILEIGYGDFPTFIKLLNKKGYDSYGIDPFAKEFDKIRTFKCKVKNLPKEITNLKFGCILANMVYSVNYANYFSKNFKWELENKQEMLKNFSKLLEDKGFLILIDDIGSIFTKEDLKKYFKLILFEKDIEITNFDKNKFEDFVKITLLQKKE